MRAVVYFRDFLVLVGGISLIFIGVEIYKALSPSEPRFHPEIFDWNIVDEVFSRDESVRATLKHGVPNTDANTKPIYRVELKTAENSNEWRSNQVVWSSQVSQRPNMRWTGEYSIEITHSSHLVIDYVPTVRLNDKTYDVFLNVVR